VEKSEHPFHSQPAYYCRGFANVTRIEIERRADTDGHRTHTVAIHSDPTLLLRTAKTDEQDLSTGGIDLVRHRRVRR